MVRLLCAVLAFAVAALPQAESELTREGGYWVQSVTAVVPAAEEAAILEVKAWGDITLRGGDGDAVAYTLRKRVRARAAAEAGRLMERIQARSERRGNVVRIEVDRAASPRDLPELSVSAPRRYVKTYLETYAGNIEAHALSGGLVAQSGGGQISAGEIGGGIHAETVGGEIRLGRIEGATKCVSGAGGIRVERAGGKTWLETVGGEIYLDEVLGDAQVSTGGGNIHVGKAAGSVVARTAGGRIEIEEAGGLVAAETVNGSILVGTAQGVECQSAEGAIRLRGVAGRLRASTASGSIFAEIPDGSVLRNSFLDTGLGDITVVIPSNLAVTIRAHNTPAGKKARIISDFPQIETSQPGVSGFEPLFAAGKINGGGPLLKVAGAGGTIYFRRR